jgi:hypothetical protein
MSSYSFNYVIDTCSLTELQRVYPIDVFPGAWDLVDRLVTEGSLGSSEQVLEELKAQDNFLQQWVKDHKHMFMPLSNDVQTQATRILSTHPTLIDLKKRKSGADPFIIASAMVTSAAVVTEERPSGGPPKVKIPDVCKDYDVQCLPILEMLRREGLKLK